jgi:hypothetical protein
MMDIATFPRQNRSEPKIAQAGWRLSAYRRAVRIGGQAIALSTDLVFLMRARPAAIAGASLPL